MSGTSYTASCPNCGNEADVYTDWKPFDSSSITCAFCGLTIYPKLEYMNLEELNNYRNQRNEGFVYEEDHLIPLTELPEQNTEIW